MKAYNERITVKQRLDNHRYLFLKSFKRHKLAYLMLLPVIVFYIVFHYTPMVGLVIAFKKYSPTLGMFGSPWVGFKYFQEFFTSDNCFRLIRNTVLISFYDLLFNFPAPIILALLFNELKNKHFKRTVQTVSYFPHFISIVVICGMIKSFTMSDGLITNLLVGLGMERAPLLQKPEAFRSIYVLSTMWQQIGWNSIIYVAALSGIDAQLYEACKIDGGGRWKQTLHVTLPGLAPTIITLLIMRLGHALSVGYEKIILLYNPSIYETADVISSFLYRKGLQEMNWSYSAAVGLFNSVINFGFLIIANTISRKVNETSLW